MLVPVGAHCQNIALENVPLLGGHQTIVMSLVFHFERVVPLNLETHNAMHY